MTYVSQIGARNIKQYKYSGSDDSYLYNYIISPFAANLVEKYIPTWLAPNTITITGLSLVASAHVFMAIYAPDMDREVPRWLYAWCGLSLLVYQVLDVADGKQARKTGNASPLGLLFDHGCDALNCLLSACTMAATLQLGPSYLTLWLLLCPSLVFFMATFEEFYTGTLALPVVNGPNEGLLIMYTIYFGCAIFGPGFWIQPCFIYPSVNNNVVFLLMTTLCSSMAIGSNVINVVESLKKKNISLLVAIYGVLPYLTLLVISIMWIYLSPTDVEKTHIRYLMWTSGLLFCKLVMHMMLAHLCDEPMNLLRKTLVVMFTAAFCAVAGFVPYTQEGIVTRLFFIVACTAYMHMVYNVIQELTTILNIRCFHVKGKNN